jgi:hypothetical protein
MVRGSDVRGSHGGGGGGIDRGFQFEVRAQLYKGIPLHQVQL